MNFNQIPTALRVPFSYVEFSNSEASSASTTQRYRLLLIGQKLAGGTAAANTLVRIQSEAQARTAFGAGSMLFLMARKALKANNFTETWAMPLADDAGGVAASSQITITGPATADGTVSLYLAGKLYSVGVLTGDTATAIAAALEDAITADTDAPVTAAVDGTDAFKVNLTYSHKGLVGNGLDAQLNLNGESLPAGVGVTIPAFASGTTDPSLTAAIAALGDEQFRSIAMPYTSAAALAAMEAEMSRRWGPLLTNDGHVFTATPLASGGAQTLGLSRNSPFVTIMSSYGSPSPAYEWAAVVAATAAFYSPIDPPRPMQTLPLVGLVAPSQQKRMMLSERNTLLYSGIATFSVDSGSNVLIERLITTYKDDAQGNPDESYLDYETMALLSYLRFDFRAYFGRKYPRHKLGKDGVVYAAGTPVMTPLLGKAEAVVLFRNWEELAYVEDADQFKRDLQVEIDPTNPNRLNFYLPPNLINGLRIVAAQIAFRS